MGRSAPPTGDLTVALAQISTCPGQLRRNLEKHLEVAERAAAAGAHLVAFPELSVSGYLLAHGVLEHAMGLDDPRLAPLVEASRRIALLVGVPLREPHGGISNAAVLLEGGEVRGVHRKLYLPTYGMFDEGRYFIPGAVLEPLACSLGRFGVLICEDAWHLSSAAILSRARLDAFVVISGGPSELDLGGEPAGGRRWHWILGAVAVTTVTPVFFTNRCGWEEGVLFGGASWAVDPRGTTLAGPAPALEESLLVARMSRAAATRARTLMPIPHAERVELWRAAMESGDA
ncbi:MAG TPA: nitrilase-related carbon-nitrogen hydrolase [Thermoanaerobaculaceae bacterium]|nr:nitrilase-related carbon-nitrogen hydrolase [Thermoanaerobaculaceae bacterium]